MTPEVLELEAEMVEAPQVGRSVALAPTRGMGGLIRPVAPPAEVLAVQEETRALIAAALKDGRDYGVIPGTSKKKNLLKPGAERVCAAFAVAATYRIVEQEVDHDRVNEYVKRSWEWHPSVRGKKVWTEEPGKSQGLYRYVIECQLVHRESGSVIGSGIGSCSSMESKYIDRPRDVENTILKMGKKRAYVDATLTTFGLSDEFTQDLEDLEPNGNGEEAQPFSLDDICQGKKHKGKPWRTVLAEDRSYAQWAVDSMDSLSPDAKKVLHEALNPPITSDGPRPVGAATLGAAAMAHAGPPAGSPLREGEAQPQVLTRGEARKLELLRDRAQEAELLKEEDRAGITAALEARDLSAVRDWIAALETVLATVGGPDGMPF